MTKRLHKSALITLIMLLLCALSMLCAFGFTGANTAKADNTSGDTAEMEYADIVFNKVTDFKISEDGTTVNGLTEDALNQITEYITNVAVDMSGAAFDNVTVIGEYAFAYYSDPLYATDVRNKKITQFNLPNNLQAINKGAFYSSGILHIHLPDSLITLGQNAFNVSSLREVNIPKNLTGMPDWKAFAGLNSLVLHIDAERAVPFNMYQSDFSNTKIAKITVPSLRFWLDYVTIDTVISLEFCDIEIEGVRLQGAIQIPEGTEKIGLGAFYDYRGITHVEIPKSVKTIGVSAFRNSTLAVINFTEDCELESIGNFAFCNTRLVDFVIPKSVTTIGTNIFGRNNPKSPYCPNLKNVYDLSGRFNKPADAEFEVKTLYNNESSLVRSGDGFLFLEKDVPELYLYDGAGGNIN